MFQLEKRYLIAYQVLNILDMWSSVTSAPYMSYTVHNIDPQCSLQSRCLKTLLVPQDYNTGNLADVRTETLTNWSLDPVN